MKKKIVDDTKVSYLEDCAVPYDENRDFTTLTAWKNARSLRLFIYKSVIPLLPNVEMYHLASQMRKASVSCTANIAEGYGRFHYQEGIQFYRISRASMYELKDHLITCLDLKYIDAMLFNEGIFLIEEAKKTLNGYIGYVKKEKEKAK
ncbi:MAG: four helix bundle protein [Candidatus Halalkalibacterium sp. M3_1C_030]